MSGSTVPQGTDVNAKLDLLLEKFDHLEARLAAREAGTAQELQAPLDLAMAGMTDDMVQNLVRRLSGLAEVILDPGVAELMARFQDPRVQASLLQLTDPDALEAFAGLASGVSLMQAGLTDDMVKSLMTKGGTLAELVLDPFVLDALQTMGRALKAGQTEYPDEKVPPVGGIFAAMREANDSDTRRVMAFALAVMRNLGKEFS